MIKKQLMKKGYKNFLRIIFNEAVKYYKSSQPYTRLTDQEIEKRFKEGLKDGWFNLT